MPSSISLITLGIADVPRATRFYKALGFVTSKRASQEDVTSMRAGSVVLALCGRQAQLEHAQAEDIWTGNGGIVVARNLASEAEVDAATAQAEAASARVLKPAAKTFRAATTATSSIPTDMFGR
jgi:predicted lactoylglutathione lyase